MLGLECERWPVDCQPERRDESEREKELRYCKSLLPEASYKRTRHLPYCAWHHSQKSG